MFYLGLVVFLAAAASFAGLTLLNRAQKEAREVLLTEVREKQGTLRTDLVNQIFLLDERLKNLRTLLAGHVFSSNVLRFVESTTLPQVRFINFSFDASSRKLDMTGEAISYAVLARQIGIFERDPNIEKVEFGGLSLGANNFAGFKITLIFKKSFLNIRP